MPNVVPLGGARYLAGLAGYFASPITILRATTTQDAYNADVAAWAPLDGHSDLPAHVGTGDVGVRLKNQEFRTSQTVSEVQQRRVFIAGAYNEIEVTDRARFEDEDWAIISVVVDSTSTLTELKIERLTPGNL